MDLKIEKDVPAPRKGWGVAEVIRKMEKGDSLFIPGWSTNSASNIARMIFGRSAVIARKQEGGVRIWRVK